jgi:dTDP-4-dehydrorhamnose 3,5-epimerase
MQGRPLELPEVLLLEPRVFGDRRGYFLEIFQARRYAEAGVPGPFVQDNLSFSRHGVVRGLHYQLAHPQGKLVMVAVGRVFDVVLDIRRGSPTFGRWVSLILEEESHRQLYIPPGFAHGFQVLSQSAVFLYKCTDYWAPGDEYGVRFDDPDLGIPWPVPEAILSDKDRELPRLRDIPPEQLPEYGRG